ncbi:tRNA splicing endonuclease subunit [Saccharomycopsis crataegensis]|uniref:tRNA-intron lyase n=1 Tax=Saccharomycopsis crataegensis TaxID=43959 RepID=A0AAV5QPW2_9ASCO|nr:tRNA splicing endonuclease subunit [Saccharomycopsis crataegensis]
MVKRKIPITIVGNRALVFDLPDIKILREEYHVLGVLSGTLPVAPQQSIFLSVPLQLSIEEVLYLVAMGRAYLIHEKQVTHQFFETWTDEDTEKYLNKLWEGHKKDIKQKQREIFEKRHFFLQKTKKKQQRNKQKTEGLQSDIGKEEGISNHDLLAEESQKEIEVDSSNINLIFYKTEDSSRGLSNYDWLVEIIQHSDGFQRRMLFGYIKNHLINKYNGVVDVSHLEIDNLIYDTIDNAVAVGTAGVDLEKLRHRCDRLISSVRFIQSIHSRAETSQYYVLPGLKFGSKFVVYPGDPLRYHSHHIVNFFNWDEEIDLMRFVNGGRLAVGVKKLWVVSGIKPKEKIKDAESSSNSATEEIDGFINALFDGNGDKEVVNFSVEWAGFG